jgi:hypothetical protein
VASAPPPAREDKAAIEHTVLELLARRGATSSVCPSEVARALWPLAWREHMSDVREVARDLAARGLLRVTQRGRPVDPRAPWRGPVRLVQPPDNPGA